MRIAIDCDGTLFRWGNYPTLGEEIPNAFLIVHKLLACGHKLVINTCRSGKDQHPLIIRLQDMGLVIPVESQKSIADLYIDDKALGCPLIETSTDYYVDWYSVEQMLLGAGILTAIRLGA